MVLFGKTGVGQILAQMFSNLGLAIKRLSLHPQTLKAGFLGVILAAACRAVSLASGL